MARTPRPCRLGAWFGSWPRTARYPLSASASRPATCRRTASRNAFASAGCFTGGPLAGARRVTGAFRLAPLVRVDQVFFAGRALVVGGHDLRLQDFCKRDFGRVVAGERGLQFVGDTLAQPLGLGR